MANYRITGERLTGIADQARRLGGIIGPLSPEYIERTLEGVTLGSDLPAAEENSFGVVESVNEYGLLTLGATAGTWNNYGGGYEFTANENISVVGIRVWAGTADYTNTSVTCGLWDDNGNLLASCSVVRDKTEKQGFFDNPVNLTAGKNYVVSANTWYMPYIFTSKVTLNPKITYVQGRTCSCGSSGGPTHPATEKGTGTIYGIADIIIGESQVPAPEEYVVQLETMNDIANEVNRIIGGSEKLTPGQILTALQGVAVQSTE